MKRFFAIIALATTLFTSCEPTTNTPPPVQEDEKNLLITENIINVTAKGGEYEIRYTIAQEVEGVELEATTTAEWISDIVIGDRISFKVAANKSKEQRVGFINVSYGADECTVGVQQKSKDDKDEVKITLESSSVTISAKGGACEVRYNLTNADEEEKVKAISDGSEWISDITIDDEKLSFMVSKNPSTAERKATLTLICDTASVDLKITQEASTNEPILTASLSAVHVGESVTFSVEYAGEDVTAESKIYDYYSNEEIANPATFSEVGERALYASYNNMKSKLVSISVFPTSAPDFPVDSNPKSYNFKHRMLLIDHTGTNCGYCPGMMLALQMIEEDPEYNDYFNVAMAHSYNTSDPAYSSTALSMRYYYEKTLKVLTGFPTLTYNYQFEDSAGSNIAYIRKHFNSLKKESTDVAVAVSAKLDGNKVVVSASLKTKEADHYKINILLLEDDIYGRQSGATYEWMNTHNNAIRASYAQVDYTDITGAEWGYVGAESTTHKVFELPIEDSRIVKTNCKVLVIIAAKDAKYGNKYEVVNTTMCDLDQSKPFEYR